MKQDGLRKQKQEKTHNFPLSGTDADPKGLALHYEVRGGGSACTIVPNIWRHFSTYAQRRKESRSARRKEREIDDIARDSMMNDIE